MKKNILKGKSKFGLVYMTFLGTMDILSNEDYERTLHIKTETIFKALDDMLDSLYFDIKDKLINSLIENSKKPIRQQEKAVDIYNGIILEFLEEMETIKKEA